MHTKDEAFKFFQSLGGCGGAHQESFYCDIQKQYIWGCAMMIATVKYFLLFLTVDLPIRSQLIVGSKINLEISVALSNRCTPMISRNPQSIPSKILSQICPSRNLSRVMSEGVPVFIFLVSQILSLYAMEPI